MTRIEQIKKRLADATPQPWPAHTANYPFYVDLRKPAASMSKHDDTRPSYWRYEDGLLMANAPADLEYLLTIISELTAPLESIAKQGTGTGGCSVFTLSKARQIAQAALWLLNADSENT